ncbi:MAG: hypothetical protein MI684_07815 [Chlorobiales bacterium]|nr:hypothetical protein [Chlorobiales bacterium]
MEWLAQPEAWVALATLTALEIVLGIDNIITAVGLAEEVGVMVTAIVISIAIMMLAAKSINDFVDLHPTIKMPALSFLILVGATLVAEGAGFEFPKGYIYFAMAFSVSVEMLNLRLRKKQTEPVHLRKSAALESVGE